MLNNSKFFLAILTLAFFSSSVSPSFAHASDEVENLVDTENACVVALDGAFALQNSIDTAKKIQKVEAKLYKKIARAKNGRTAYLSLSEVERTRAVKIVQLLLSVSREQGMTGQYTSLFFDVRSAYENYRRYESMYQSLKDFTTENLNASDSAKARKTLVKNGLINANDNWSDIVGEVQGKMASIQTEMIKEVTIIANNLNLYLGVNTMLKKYASTEDTMGLKAKQVLEDLESKNLLADSFERKNLDQIITPTDDQLQDLMTQYLNVRLSVLKQQATREWWATKWSYVRGASLVSALAKTIVYATNPGKQGMQIAAKEYADIEAAIEGDGEISAGSTPSATTAPGTVPVPGSVPAPVGPAPVVSTAPPIVSTAPPIVSTAPPVASTGPSITSPVLPVLNKNPQPQNPQVSTLPLPTITEPPAVSSAPTTIAGTDIPVTNFPSAPTPIPGPILVPVNNGTVPATSPNGTSTDPSVMNVGALNLKQKMVAMAKAVYDRGVLNKYGQDIFLIAFGNGTTASQGTALDIFDAGTNGEFMDTFVRLRGLPNNLWSNIKTWAQAQTDQSLYIRMVASETRTANQNRLSILGRDKNNVMSTFIDLGLSAETIHLLIKLIHPHASLDPATLGRQIASFEDELTPQDFRTTPLNPWEEEELYTVTNAFYRADQALHAHRK